MSTSGFSRRSFLGATLPAATFTLLPRHVLGGEGRRAPSEAITRAVVGTGGMGHGHIHTNKDGEPPVTLAVCDVDKKHLASAIKKAGSGCTAYTDFRDILDRRDIDTVEIATPPHWHALTSIHAAQAGFDVLCEKPMTRFIREGQAVIDAIHRYGRVYQIGTYGRFGSTHLRKLVASRLLGTPLTVRVGARTGYNWKVQGWSGHTHLVPQPVPPELDYNLWLGPSPWKPYHPHRVHGSFRCYWDYDGGGLADMGQHYLDPITYWLDKDDTDPVEIEAYAPQPAHDDAVRLWGRVTMRYEDGTTLILESGEWGEPEPGDHAFIEGPKGKAFGSGGGVAHTDPPGLMEQAAQTPDPPRMIGFHEAVRTRRQPGGSATSSHRACCLMHLANVAIRTGRKLRYDPVAQTFPGDEEANRLVDVPMRAPWHL
ncbi:MAG TPA: Gfo/Idh/MocA family oxidoreductase [Planctomycetota bacterium]|nr:Gfo/Idh/MocA family oxidoreductase [Planctomycetota bacterium]